MPHLASAALPGLSDVGMITLLVQCNNIIKIRYYLLKSTLQGQQSETQF